MSQNRGQIAVQYRKGPRDSMSVDRSSHKTQKVSKNKFITVYVQYQKDKRSKGKGVVVTSGHYGMPNVYDYTADQRLASTRSRFDQSLSTFSSMSIL